MSRFAPIAPSKVKNVKPDSSSYKFGFHSSTDKYAFKSGKGLSLKVVEDISSRKNEQWMRKERLTGLKIFEKKKCHYGAQICLQ